MKLLKSWGRRTNGHWEVHNVADETTLYLEDIEIPFIKEQQKLIDLTLKLAAEKLKRYKETLH